MSAANAQNFALQDPTWHLRHVPSSERCGIECTCPCRILDDPQRATSTALATLLRSLLEGIAALPSHTAARCPMATARLKQLALAVGHRLAQQQTADGEQQWLHSSGRAQYACLLSCWTRIVSRAGCAATQGNSSKCCSSMWASCPLLQRFSSLGQTICRSCCQCCYGMQRTFLLAALIKCDLADRPLQQWTS